MREQAVNLFLSFIEQLKEMIRSVCRWLGLLHCLEEPKELNQIIPNHMRLFRIEKREEKSSEIFSQDSEKSAADMSTAVERVMGKPRISLPLRSFLPPSLTPYGMRPVRYEMRTEDVSSSEGDATSYAQGDDAGKNETSKAAKDKENWKILKDLQSHMKEKWKTGVNKEDATVGTSNGT